MISNRMIMVMRH